MKAVKASPATHLEADEAAQISRETWGDREACFAFPHDQGPAGDGRDMIVAVAIDADR